MIKKTNLKDEYKLDDLPEPCITSADLDNLDDSEITYKDARRFFLALERAGYGTRFTQVDGDDGERYYVKGFQHVNNTGICAFVFDKKAME